MSNIAHAAPSSHSLSRGPATIGRLPVDGKQRELPILLDINSNKETPSDKSALLNQFFSTVLPDQCGIWLQEIEDEKRIGHNPQVRRHPLPMARAIQKAIDLIEKPSPANFGLFYCTCQLVESEDGHPRNRNGENARLQKTLRIDIDSGPSKPHTSCDQAIAAFDAFLKTTQFPKPTIKVITPNGMHIYWAFGNPIDTREWEPLANALAIGLEKAGLKVDTSVTTDAVKLLRVPFSTHYKDPKNPRQIHWDGLIGKIYSVDRLRSAIRNQLNTKIGEANQRVLVANEDIWSKQSLDGQKETIRALRKAMRQQQTAAKGSDSSYSSPEAKAAEKEILRLGAPMHWCWEFTEASLTAITAALTKDDVNKINRNLWVGAVLLAARFAPVESDDANKIKSAVRKWSERHSCYEEYLTTGIERSALEGGEEKSPFDDFDSRWAEGECKIGAEKTPIKLLLYLRTQRAPLPRLILSDGTAVDIFNLDPLNSDGLDYEATSEELATAIAKTATENDPPEAPTKHSDPIDELNDNFAWDLSEMNLYNIETGYYTQKDKFLTQYVNRNVDVPHGGKIRSTPLGTAWITSPRRRNATKVVMAPDQPKFLPDGTINSWRGYSCKPIAGDITPFMSLLERLIPNPTERDFVLNWLAKLVQNPAQKFHVALVIWSLIQGTGKNLIFEAIGNLFNDRHYILVTQSVFEDAFTEWQSDKVFVIADEVSSTEKRAVSDKIKGWITATKNHINIKNSPKTSQPNLIKYVFLSNHPDAIHLNDTDRRYFVVEATSKVLGEAETNKYIQWRDNGGLPALLHYLLQHDASSFNPTAPAPTSQAKLDMVESNRSDLERWLAQAISGAQGTNKPLLSAQALAHQYKTETSNSCSTKTVANTLQALGAHRIKKPARFQEGTRIRLFTAANPELYESMTDIELGEAFHKQIF